MKSRSWPRSAPRRWPCSGPAAGLGSAGEREASQLGSVLKRAQQVRDIQMTDEEETKLGEAVSERIRQRYGVVQDPAIHKYVTLVGGVLAQASTRPGLHWRFIVLDTDGVNALAAPGGLVHITRGALSLIKSEAELAGVLGHEIIHVTEKHTIKAIQKGKMVQMGADETVGSAGVFNKLVDKATGVVMAGFRPRGGARSRPQGHRHRQHGGLQPQRPERLSDDACRTQQGVDRKAGAVCLAPRDEGAIRQARRHGQDQQAHCHRHRRGALQETRHLRAGRHHRDCDRRGRARRALPAAAPPRQTTRPRPTTRATARPRSRRRSEGSVSAG